MEKKGKRQAKTKHLEPTKQESGSGDEWPIEKIQQQEEAQAQDQHLEPTKKESGPSDEQPSEIGQQQKVQAEDQSTQTPSWLDLEQEQEAEGQQQQPKCEPVLLAAITINATNIAIRQRRDRIQTLLYEYKKMNKEIKRMKKRVMPYYWDPNKAEAVKQFKKEHKEFTLLAKDMKRKEKELEEEDRRAVHTPILQRVDIISTSGDVNAQMLEMIKHFEDRLNVHKTTLGINGTSDDEGKGNDDEDTCSSSDEEEEKNKVQSGSSKME